MNDFPSRNPQFNVRKLGGSDYSSRQVSALYGKEIESLIKMLLDKSLNESLKEALRKYLLVKVFAALEYFFRNEVKKLVDKNNLDITLLFQGETKTLITKFDKIVREKSATRGNIVVSSFSFVNFDHIDFVFSKLLCLESFLDYIIKLNDMDQTRQVLDGHPLPIEYEKLKKAYRLRNEIVHEVSDVKTSNSMIIALWDNLFNIVEIARTVFMSMSDQKLRSSLDNDYHYGIQRARRKSIFKLYSDMIMSKLVEKGQLPIIYTDAMTLHISEISNNDDDVIKQNINWIVSRMRREKLIETYGSIIKLSSKGLKRYKRTKENERAIWKKNILSK